MKQPLETPADTKESMGMEKQQHDLGLVEAALYVAGRPLDLNELGSILKTRSKNRTRKLAKTLMQEYTHRNMALEILELKDERYVLQLKADYTPHVKRLVTRPLLSTGPLKTLSYIAYRQPVSQKRVIDVRGHHAYGHVKMLKEMGLIASERSGRSWALRTTEYFADYFALSHDTSAMKRELKQVFEETAKQETLPV
ncbi:MAG TPA: SMC-Scp complex subunit ScpB [Candidatus Eisenbacteria bacterium]|nr:SMC-Scp complex subunit ScpB [Candidatus Eisenbacteria bacterium]